MSDGYRGFSGVAQGTELGNIAFIVREIMTHYRQSTVVKIIKVYPGDASKKPTLVDVQPVIDQIDPDGNRTPHGTIYGVVVPRHHGGGNSIIVDPSVGDVGLMHVGDRDHSSVVANSGGNSAPDSGRKFSFSDGLYWHGIWTPPPTNYHDTRGGNLKSVSTQGQNQGTISHTVNDTNNALLHDQRLTPSSGFHLEVQNAKHTQDLSPSNGFLLSVQQAAHIISAHPINGINLTSMAVVNAMAPNVSIAATAGNVAISAAQSISLAAPFVGIGAGAMSGSAVAPSTLPTAAIAPSNGTVTPTAGQFGEPVTTGDISPGVTVSNMTNATIGSIPLTPGIWLIWGTIATTNTTATISYVIGTASLTPASLVSLALDIYLESGDISISSGDNYSHPIGQTRLVLTSNATIYMNAVLAFSGGSMQVGGRLSALRVG